ncbi:MAG: hypothetical protein ACK559_20220, partial [bacterium]
DEARPAEHRERAPRPREHPGAGPVDEHPGPLDLPAPLAGLDPAVQIPAGDGHGPPLRAAPGREGCVVRAGHAGPRLQQQHRVRIVGAHAQRPAPRLGLQSVFA